MIVDRRTLVDQLTLAKKVIGGRTSIEALACIRMHVNGGDAYMQATDMETTLQLPIATLESMSKFDLAVNAAELLALLKSVSYPNVYIDITAGPNALVLVTDADVDGPAQATIPESSLADFPKLPVLETVQGEIILTTEDLGAACRAVVPAASKDTSRPMLTCVCIDTTENDGQPWFIATDSYRMHGYHSHAVVVSGTGQYAVPARFLVLIEGYARKTKAATVHLRFGESRCVATVTGSDAEFGIRLGQGQFPKWEQILPDRPPFSVTFDAESLVLCAKAAAAKLKGSNSPVVLDLRAEDGGPAVWRARTPDGSLTMPIMANGGPWPEAPYSMGVNPDFLPEAVRCADVSPIVTAMTNPLKPILFEGERSWALVMGIRLPPLAFGKQPDPEPEPAPEPEGNGGDPDPEPSTEPNPGAVEARGEGSEDPEPTPPAPRRTRITVDPRPAKSKPTEAALTSARRAALFTLGQVRLATRSNENSVPLGRVYWQTCDWLIAEELAYYPSGSTLVRLTPKGRALYNRESKRIARG